MGEGREVREMGEVREVMGEVEGERVKAGRTDVLSSMSREEMREMNIWWVVWEAGGRGMAVGRVARKVVMNARGVRAWDSRAERLVRDGGSVAWMLVRALMCSRALAEVVEGSQRRRTWWRWGLEGRRARGFV